VDLNELKRHELYRRGVIAKTYLKSFQFELYNLLNDSSNTLIVPNTSRRFGKSTVCVTYCVEQALRAKRHVRYATAFLSDLESFIEPIFASVLENCPGDTRPEWMASKKVWKFRNGSTIKLIGIDKNPNGLRGNNLDILIVDEAAFIQNLEYLYKSVIIPATMKRDFKLVFPSTPPRSPEHYWSRELIPKAKANGTYLELTIDSITDLPPEEKQRLIDEVGGINSSTAQREFYCKVVVDETRAVAPSFRLERHVATVDYQYIKWDYVGDSGGLRDRTSILQVGYSHLLDKVIIRSELTCDPNTPTPVLADKFRSWSGTDTFILDAHGQTRVDLAALNLKVSMPVKDDFTAGIQMMNAAFHNDNVIIDPSCTLLIASLTSGLLTADRKDYERTERLGHCDSIAALIYALRHVDKQVDLRPPPPKEQIWSIPKPSPAKAILKAFE
jgi:hypothetical protein